MPISISALISAARTTVTAIIFKPANPNIAMNRFISYPCLSLPISVKSVPRTIHGKNKKA
jgi:hypothetical protein